MTAATTLAPLVESKAHIRLSHWTCIASEIGDPPRTVPEDIGRHLIELEIKIPRTGFGTDDERALADQIAEMVGGQVTPCAGGEFGNSYIVRVKSEVPA